MTTRSTTRSLLLTLALSAPWRFIFFEPCTAQTLYATVWGNPKYVVGSSTLESGLFRTTDMGATWEHLGPQNLKAFGFDAVDATRGGTMYIAAGNGIHRSLDSGRTWKIVTDWRMTEVLDVSVEQSGPNVVHAATAYGYWRSTDGGDTWEHPEGSLAEVFVREIWEDGAIYASTEEEWTGGSSYGFWMSEAGGDRWSVAGEMERPEQSMIDSFHTHGRRPTLGGARFAATWGGGVYRQSAEGWRSAGLAGSQVWDLVVKEY